MRKSAYIVIVSIILIFALSGCGTTVAILSSLVNSPSTLVASDHDGEENVSSIILPSYLQTGLILWLDATEITGVTDNELLNSWSDKSPSGNDLTQSTDANKPTYNMNVINGMPAVCFEGLDMMYFSGLKMPGNRTLSFIFQAPLPPRPDNWNIIMDVAGGGCYAAVAIDNNGELGSYDGDTWNFRGTGFDTDGLASGNHIMTVMSSSTASTTNYYIDGVFVGTSALVAEGANITIFNNYESNKSENMIRNCAELMVYRRELNSSDRQELESYLDRKWQLGLGL